MKILKFYKNDFHIESYEVDAIRKTPILENTPMEYKNIYKTETTFRIAK